MKRQNKGVIINIASEAYVYGTRSPNIAYTAAKGGIISLTHGLTREVEGFDIRVNAISPWHIGTEKLLNILRINGVDEKEVLEKNKLHKRGLPEDVAYCALFLASDFAKFIHGAVININGGAGSL